LSVVINYDFDLSVFIFPRSGVKMLHLVAVPPEARISALIGILLCLAGGEVQGQI
jgi:hypothetical protein